MANQVGTPLNRLPVRAFPGFFWEKENKVQIKGDGPSGLDFPATTATVNPNTGDAAVTNVQSVEALPNHVYRYDPLFIDWYISHDEGASWLGPFKSGNELFVTLAEPQCAVPFRTVLYLATKGSQATTESQCVADTWANFSGRAVCRWHESTKQYDDPMYYYNGYTGVTSAAGMLASQDGNGQCHAWADLFKESLRANGVENVKRVRVLPPDEYGPYEETDFAVRNIGFADPPTYPGEQKWRYSQADLDASVPGIPGQNVATPALKVFFQHFAVRRAGQGPYYDPSYGISADDARSYTSGAVNAWENEEDYTPSRWCDATGDETTNLRLLEEDW